MATIGLKIAQDPDTSGALSLADTLAKATFGDPEGQMKARALASEVGVRMASRDKLIADTGLVNIKTKQEQALADAQDAAARAGPSAANAAANANALPVEAPRPSLDAGGYGPQPGIVDPNVVKMRDAIIAQNNAEWPVIVRSSNGVQLVEAGSKLAGAAALEGGLVPGARVDPNVQRVAGGLYTGSAPTTSTVWSPGDTSGVDAAAREHILEKQAESTLPEKPHDVTYRGQPGQTYRDPITGKLTYTGAAGTETTPEKPDVHDYRGQPGIVTVDANGNPMFTPAQGTAPTPVKPEKPDTVVINGQVYQIGPPGPDGKATLSLLQGGPAAEPPKTEELDPKKPKMIWDGTKFVPAPGAPTAPADGGAFAGSNSPEGISLNIVTGTASKLQDPNYKPSFQEASDYAAGYNHLYEQPKPVEYKLEDGSTGIRWVASPPPAGAVPPSEVFRRGGFAQQGGPPAGPQPPAPPVQPPSAGPPPAPPAAPPAVPPAAPPVATPPVVAAPPTAPAAPPAGGPVGSVVVQPLSGPAPPKPATEAQSKARQFLPSLQIATQTLDKYNKSNLPGVWELGYTTPSEELGTFGKFVESSPAISDNARRFGSAANQWTSASLYDLSGAAIGKGEFDRSVRGMLPRPGDPQDVIDTKTKLRHAFLDAVAGTAYANDPKVLALLAQGKSLNPDGSAAPPQNDGDNAPAGASQGVKDAWSHLSTEAKDRARKRYGQ